MATIRETLIAGALAIGAEEVETRSSKYRVFHVKAGTVMADVNGDPCTLKNSHYLFFGKAGACRTARRNAATVSRDSEGWRRILVNAARA